MGAAIFDEGAGVTAARPRTGNRILDLLGEEGAALFPSLEAFHAKAELAPGFLVFPAPGTVLARVLVLDDGRIAQVALIGADGLSAGLLHDPFGRDRLQTVVPGDAWRVPNQHLAPALDRSGAFRDVMTAQDSRLLHEAWHGIACAALHQVEQRLAHWLMAVASVAAHGEDPRADLPVTQAMLAALLGLRRTTVTRAITTLEERGLIQHRRGRVAILDRAGLQAAACECHGRSRARINALQNKIRK